MEQFSKVTRIYCQHTDINHISIDQEQNIWKSKSDVPFTITLKTKQLGINLTKKVKDQCNENYKTLMKEIEESTDKWKGTLCSRNREYYENVHPTQNHLLLQKCNLYQNSNSFSPNKNENTILKIFIALPNTLNI